MSESSLAGKEKSCKLVSLAIGIVLPLGLSATASAEHAEPDPDRQVTLEQVQPLLRDRRLRCSKCNLHSDSFFPPYPGFRARTKALMNLPSTCGATASRFSPEPASNSRASSIR